MAYEISRRRYGGDPFRDMMPLRTVMDRLLENAFMPAFFGEGQAGSRGFGMDVDEDDDYFYVSCNLPGVNPDDVQIQVHDNVLSISGETRRSTPEGRRSVVQESSYGRFERQVALGTPVDAAKAEAEYRDGILEVRLPKAEASKPRSIPVRGAEGSRSLGQGQSGQGSQGSQGNGAALPEGQHSDRAKASSSATAGG